MNSGKLSKIKVTSQLEIQGFGEYTYGRWYKAGLKNPSMEEGKYEYTFSVPASWKNKMVSIIFEGVMTDTDVKINGLLGGETHQGGFYRFSYNITDKLKVGVKNWNTERIGFRTIEFRKQDGIYVNGVKVMLKVSLF